MSILNAKDDRTWTPLALAMHNYHHMPNILNLTFINQLFFSLALSERIEAVDQPVKLNGDSTLHPIWHYAVEFSSNAIAKIIHL